MARGWRSFRHLTATLRHPATLSGMLRLISARIHASWDDDWRLSCMVNRLRLNEKSVRDAEPAKGRAYQIFDTDVRGFADCIYRSGSRAFTIDYRHAGRHRCMTIGRWPEWSTTTAREHAKELRREIDAGADPLGQKELGRDAPRVKDMIAHYSNVHVPNLSPTNA